ncbi:MAG: hypothetical protein AAF581_20665, partial [Planctomycetota bacterium]
MVLRLACLLLILVAPQLASGQLSFALANGAATINNTYTSGPFSLSHYCSGGACGDFNNDGWQDVF